jgi:hypothetical protein
MSFSHRSNIDQMVSFRVAEYLAITRNFDGPFAKLAFERFLALAVSGVVFGVGNGFILIVTKVLSHLGFNGTFDQSFGELLEKPVFSNEVFRLFVIRQQAVYQFVAYGDFSSFEDEGSFLPLNRLHKI